MNVNKLVESIVKPFLEEDTNLQYDNCSPADKNEDNYPLGECEMLNQILRLSTVPAIQRFADVDYEEIVNAKTRFSKEKNVSSSWEERNSDMADKLGYELIDYIDGDINNANVPISFGIESKFMDISGNICEEYSIRDAVRQSLISRRFLSDK